ncbi:MAG: VanZ family protein [Vicinamibacterales bacterium]
MDARTVAEAELVSPTRRLVRTVWLLSALFIVYGTTIPFSFDALAEAVTLRLMRIGHTTPWALHAVDRLSIPDVVQNILLFVPFGVLGFLGRPTSGRAGAAWRVVVVTVLGTCLSLAVEVLQLFTADRTASLTDLAANSSGAGGGAVAAWLLRGTALRLLRQLARAGFLETGTFYPVLVYGALLGVAAWEPFDVTLDVGSVAHKVRLFLDDPWQFRGVDDEGLAVLQSALLAGALSSYLSARGRPSAAVSAAALGALLGVALEGSQALIEARQPGLADALVRVAGACAGAAAWTLTRRGRHGLLAATALGTTLAAAMQLLSPFTLADHYQRVQWVPFLNYYTNTSVDTVSHAIELLLLFLPLGFVTGGTDRSRRGALRLAVAIALLVAVPLEFAQGWIRGRFPDVTDVVLAVAGAWGGAWLATTGADGFAQLTRVVGPVARSPYVRDLRPRG